MMRSCSLGYFGLHARPGDAVRCYCVPKVRRKFLMNEHDPRCQGGDDQKVLNDVTQHGWHVVNVFDSEDIPGWAFSIGLFHTFRHPEIIVFGLNPDLMQSIINSVGDGIRSGTRYEVGKLYPDLIEAYSCVFKDVNQIWYGPFLGYATWFYKGTEFPALQCIWPDKHGLYPWEQGFRTDWLWAQPLLFHEQPDSARATVLLRSMGIERSF